MEDRNNQRKTIRDFDAAENIGEIIEQWAKKAFFSKGNPLMKKTMDTENIPYCYHSAGVYACAYLTINITDNKAHMEAWIEYDLLIRLVSFFIIPKQQKLESKSPVQALQRLMYKRKISKLLVSLGQPKI
ncbi:MAG: hypothetical protein JXN65_01995 [Clostridia bacterium]|nr:hypothetical protein [Clostridia bacterium]